MNQYLRPHEAKTCRNEYSINILILSIQENDIFNLFRHLIEIFLGLLHIYFNIDIVVIKDNTKNNNFNLNKYLNNLSLHTLLLFKLDLKVGCSITLLQNIALH